MAARQIGIALPVDDGVTTSELVELAVTAEELGFGTIMAGEVRGPDVFALLGAVAARTQRAQLGTAVVGVRTRSPMLTAMGFAALASLAPGRVLAGLGVSSRQIVEGWHERSFPPPLQQVIEAVPRLKALLAGDSVPLATGGSIRLTEPARPAIPILIGALNPQMRRLAAETADGAVLAWADPDETAEAVAEIRAAAAEAGRRPEELTIAAAIFAYAGDDPDAAVADITDRIVRYSLSVGHRGRMRRHLPEVDEVARLWARGRRDAASAAVTPAAVAAYSAIGSAADVAERVQLMQQAGVDLPLIYPLAARRGGAATATMAAVAAELEGP